MHYDESDYTNQLTEKVASVKGLLDQSTLHSSINFHVFPSPRRHYRNRCRFGVLAKGQNMHYVMWEKGRPCVKVNRFPIASKLIYIAMPLIKALLTNEAARKADEEFTCLLDGIEAMHFLSSSQGELLISIIYGKPLNPIAKEKVESLRENLHQRLLSAVSSIDSCSGKYENLRLRLRAKGETYLAIDDDTKNNYIQEALEFEFEGVQHRYVYLQTEDGFSNPNPSVAAKSVAWLCGCLKDISTSNKVKGKQTDLLELYCGNGNHTVALSQFTNRVVAVELNKTLCVLAKENMILNGVSNVEILQSHSESFSKRVLKSRKYSSGGNDYSFSAVLVDPPREGLDANTLDMIRGYEDILYISCNPTNLFRDLNKLNDKGGYEIIRFAVFDHFAYTPHLECGVHIRRKFSS
jgi:tRNA (uracil-5-)-methyltransferase